MEVGCKVPKVMPASSRPLKFLGLAILFALLAFLYWQYLRKTPKSPIYTQPVSQKESISENEALKIIAEQSEVKNYLKEVPNGEITLDHFDQDSNSYIFQVFEVKNRHTSTFNWYEVNKDSRELKRLLP